jgi:ABC-type cobalamin transport system ATPase subunit
MVRRIALLLSEPGAYQIGDPTLALNPGAAYVAFMVCLSLSGVHSVVQRTLCSITRGGQSVLLVEQNVHHSLRLADRAHVLENGRLVRSGETRQDKAIQQAYLGL